MVDMRGQGSELKRMKKQHQIGTSSGITLTVAPSYKCDPAGPMSAHNEYEKRS